MKASRRGMLAGAAGVLMVAGEVGAQQAQGRITVINAHHTA
jgi:hypothetical protein